MHLGVLLAHLGPSADQLSIGTAARSADVLGYHSLWAVDPRLAPAGSGGRDGDGAPGVDAIEALTTAAGCTDRVLLGLHVHPAQAAQVLATSPTDRVPEGGEWITDRLSLAVELAPGTAPTELHRPPGGLLVAGTDAGAAVQAAWQADGWFATGSSLDAIERTWSAILADAVAAGRDPAGLRLVVRADIGLTDRPLSRHRSTFRGSLEQVVDDLVALGRIGAASVVLAFVGHHELDELLGGYAAIAEGLELRSPA